jgi:hypothetical protein
VRGRFIHAETSLAIVFLVNSLLCLSQIPLPVESLIDEFPVGLHLEYDTFEYDAYGNLTSEFVYSYSITDKVNSESYQLEAEINNNRMVKNIEFPNEFLNYHTTSQLWADISNWQAGQEIVLASIEYDIISDSIHLDNSFYTLDCYYLNRIRYVGLDTNLNISLFFDKETGILVESQKALWNYYNPSDGYDYVSVLRYDNFNEFYETTSSSSTNDHTENAPMITGYLIIGIVIESMVICFLLRERWIRRKSH